MTMRVLSGVQPSGALHLGNYLGALKKFAKLQYEAECFYCVVDLHAITVWQDPAKLRDQTREIAACYLASGVDPSRAAVFAQSSVRAHVELAWIFNCVARLGWLDRMTQFKDKAGKDKERASVGLYTYPVLQAADILVYKATHVPVGEDQRQHLELTRDVAKKFNHDFGVDYFPLPETLYQGPGARIMSLRDGTQKMSKSDPSDQSRINLTDDADAIAAKIRKAKSDPEPLPESVDGLRERPEAENLVGIYATLMDMSAQAVLDQFGGKGFGAFKPALAEVVVEKMSPVSARLRELLADKSQIDAILNAGAERANAVAEPILRKPRNRGIMVMKKLILAAVAVLALAACDKGPTQTTSTTVSHTSDATGQKRTDALKITGYVMRSALGNNPNTVAYLTVKNDGDSDDKLVSAACDCAATTSLHTTSTKAGVMDMEEATDGFVIKPGETLTFAPGGNHVMLAGLKVRPKAGDTEVVSLTFAKAGVIKLDVPVSDTPQGG